MIKAKKSGAGHKMYKVCRRVLSGPIVAEDTYCLEVVGKELRGEGEVNAQGEPEGRGTMVYASGDMYEGQWLAGQKHGQCMHTFATGNAYEGELVKNQKHGHGKLTNVDGSSYDGEWTDDKKHGIGTYTYANGSFYVGEHYLGKMHGHCKSTFAGGSSYDGEYANGNRHGMGTATFADGMAEVRCYEEGAEVDQGVRWSADRATAWELQDGAVVREIPLDEAAMIAGFMDLPVPP